MADIEVLAKQEKTDEIIEQMIIQCYPLLMSQLNKFYMYNDPDALSFAYEALYKAIITYNMNGTTKFITYATVCIYNRLGSYLRAVKNRPIDIPLHMPIAESGDELMAIVDSGQYTDLPIIIDDFFSKCDKIIVDMIGSMKNEKHRTILNVWRDSEYDMSHSDIARQVKLSQSYVTQTIHMFRHAFKKKLEDLENGKSV